MAAREEGGRGVPRRGALRRAAAVLGALGALLLAAYLLRGVLLAPWLVARLEREVEARTGVGVAIGGVGGSWIGSIEIRDVRTVREGSTGALRSVAIDRLRASYSLPTLLRGGGAFVAAARVELDGARLALDLSPRAGEGEASRGSPGGEAPGPPAALPVPLPALRVRGLDIDADGPGLRLEVHGASAGTRRAGDGRGTELALAADAVELRSSGAVVGPLGLEAVLRPEAGAVHGTFSVPGRAVRGELGYSGGALEASLQVDGVALGADGGLLSLPEGVVRGQLTGSLQVRAGGGQPVAGSCDLELETALVRGVPLERVRFRAGLGEGMVRIGLLEVAAGSNRAELRDATLPLAALGGAAAEGDRLEPLRAATGTFSAHVGDLPALLALAGHPLRPAGPVPRHLLEVAGSVAEGAFTLTAGSLALPRGGARLERLRLALPAPGRPASEALVRLAASVDLPDVSLLNRVSPLPPLAGALTAALTLEGSAGRLAGSARVRARGLRAGDRGPADLELVARADAERLVVEEASLRVAGGADEVRVSGVVLPAPPLLAARWEELPAATSGSFSLRLADLPALAALAGHPLPLRGPAPRHLLQLSGTLDRGAVEIAPGGLTVAGGSLHLDRLGAVLPGAGQPWTAARLDARLTVDLPDLAALAAVLPLPGIAGSLRGEATFAGTVAEPAGSARLEARNLSVSGRGIGNVDLSASAAGGVVHVASATLVNAGGANRVHLSEAAFAAADAASGRWLELARGASATLMADLRDVPALLAILGQPPAEAFPEHRLRLEGSVAGARAELATAELAAAGASVRFSRARIALPAAPGGWEDATIDLDAAVEAPDLAAPAGPLRVASLRGHLRARLVARGTLRSPVGTVDADVGAEGVGELSLAGRLVREGSRGAVLELAALTLRREGLEARLAGPAQLRSGSGGALVVEGLRLEGGGATVALAGTIDTAGGSDVSVTATGLGTDGWLRGLVGEGLAAHGVGFRARLTGSREQPALALAGEVASLRGAATPRPLSGTFELSWQDGRLAAGRFAWSDGAGTELTATGKVPLDPFAERLLAPGPLDLAVRARIPDLRAVGFLLPAPIGATGGLSASLDLGGTWAEPGGKLGVELTGVRVTGLAGLGEQGPLSLALTAQLGGGDVELRSLSVSSDWVTAEASGRWAGAPSIARLLAGGGFPRVGTLALRGTFSFPDLWRFRRLAGDPERLAGRLTGEVAIGGTVADPTVEGTVRLEEGALAFAGGIPSMSRLAATAVLRDRTVRLEQAGGELGGSPFRLEGSFGWGAGAGAGVDLRLTGANLLLYRDETILLRADVDVRAHGPLGKLRLDGKALLDNSAYTRSLTVRDLFGGLAALTGRNGVQRAPRPAGAPLFSLATTPWRDMEFDLGIGAKSPVAIRSNVARGALRPELTLGGTGLRPVLQGSVFVDPGRLSLPGGSLRVDRGLVRFPPPGGGEPTVDLAGGTRLLGYDVTVRVGGALASPEVTMSSLPPLSNEELLMLVLAGTPPGTEDPKAMKRILEASLARFVAETLLGTVAPGPAGEELADRIEVEIGREVTRSGGATIETRLRLVGPTAGPGEALYLTGGSDVYDAYTMGVNLVFRFR